MNMIKDIIAASLMSVLFLAVSTSCKSAIMEKTQVASATVTIQSERNVVPGAERITFYYPQIQDKKISLVVNQTSVVDGMHLADTLKLMGADIKRIFAPEHGFRGKADAGEHVMDQVDISTGASVISLYGNKKGPSAEDMEDLDVMIFDIQDVGVRFYTFISTLHYVMQACADHNIPLIVLDRPNPNGHYIDGPVLEKKYESFVGMHPVPTVYGMTIGEYAKMINGELWLHEGIQCDLTVIPCKNYDHNTYYNLPIKPSPNLPNIQSVFLYPSLCLFEGTHVSVGRGTDMQFQIYGHPAWTDAPSKIKIQSLPGAKYPKHENKSIGYRSLQDLTTESLHKKDGLNLEYLVEMYQMLTKKGETFFLDNNFFEKLAGTDQLRSQLKAGKTADEIRASWDSGVDEFRMTREKYLLY